MEHLKPTSIVHSSDEKRWHEERGRGVTATVANRLVTAGADARERIRQEQLKPGAWKGNEHTRRGHALEPLVIEKVEVELGVPGSGFLFAHAVNRKHLATPDCFAWTEGEGAVVEVKTHFDDWERKVPRSILRQMWWQAYVCGAGYLALADWRIKKGRIPDQRDIRIRDITIDYDEIERMVAAADEYLAWVAAGAPREQGEVPAEIRAALVEFARGRRLTAEGKAVEDAAQNTIRDFIASDPGRAQGWDAATNAASVKWSVTESTTFDIDAARAGQPKLVEAWEAAQEKYLKQKTSTRLTITPREAA